MNKLALLRGAVASAFLGVPTITGAIPAPFVTVNGTDAGAAFPTYVDSWSVEYAGTPAISAGVPFTVLRQGFGGSNSANSDAHTVTSVRETMYVTSRVRQVFPNQGGTLQNFEAHRASLNDYIYSTDTVDGGAVNNSATVSPVPVANWATLHRQTVGNTLSGEIEAFHRNARNGLQVACVVVTATDGVTTVTCTVATPTISPRASDAHPVIVYAWSLDITSLTDNHLITVNAKVYPWIGGAAAVADSSLLTYAGHEREFSPRYYLKNTALAAAPVYACLSSSGNDATAVFSTTQATAIATPFLTARGMIDKINSGATGSPGKADGVIVLVGNGTFVLPTTTSFVVNQSVACLTFTRQPGVARANAIITFGVGVFRPRLSSGLTAPLATGCVRFTDVQVTRTGTGTIQGEVATRLEVQWDDVNYDNASNNINLCNNSDQYICGLASANMSASTFNANGNGQTRIIRGFTATGACSLDPWLVLGSSAEGVTLSTSVNSISGGMCAFSVFTKAISSGPTAAIAASQDVSGYALVQNVFEFIGTNPTAFLRVTADGDSGNVDHIILHHNTVVGYGDCGKVNAFYDEGPTRRHSRLQSSKGNFYCQLNQKGDVFVGVNNNGTPNPTEAPFRIENWGYLYGVGVQGEFINYSDSSGGDPPTSFFGQAYGGMGSLFGTSQTVPQVANNKFTNYQATTWSGVGTTPAAGLGGGTYSWASASPVKGIVSSSVLICDLAGTARPTTGASASAYESP